MMREVPTRKIDIFYENGAYIMQTTQHPKLTVTEFLNAFPKPKRIEQETTEDTSAIERPDRIHVKTQWALIQLGRAEGCSVWVPTNDRNLSFRKQSFASFTLERLPNFGFDENTRRIVQNIDVLWLTKNVIRKAFEVESTTVIYSGLLRLNDLILSQPNNQIDLYIVASQARRQRVYTQLVRPTFQPLIPKCQFLSFEAIEEQLKRLEVLRLDNETRISGLIRGERFVIPEHYVYPSEV
jgi:type II restriction enzyme